MAYTQKDYDEMQAVRNDAQSKKDTIDPERRAQAEKIYNDFMTERDNQNGSITNMYANDDNTVTTEYNNGTSKVTDRQWNEIAQPHITNMYGNDDGTVTTEYDNGTKQITDQQGNPIMKSNQDIAKEVRQGKRGNGQDRKNRLTEAGYDYNTIQQQVNRTAPKRPIVPPTPKPETETPKPETPKPETTSRRDNLEPSQKTFLDTVAAQNWISTDVLSDLVDQYGIPGLDDAIKDYKWKQKISRQDAINNGRDKRDIAYVQSTGWYITADWKAYKRDWSPITFFPG